MDLIEDYMKLWSVAPHAGAWIEMVLPKAWAVKRPVAPHAGAIKRYNNNINTKKPRSYKVNGLFYVVFIFIEYRFNANYFDYFRIYASQNASQNAW